MIGRTIGRFTVESKLGQGGWPRCEGRGHAARPPRRAQGAFRSRWRPRPTSDDGSCARPKAAAALDHPAVAAVYDAGEHDGLLYIAFACIDGDTVSDLAVHGPLDVERVARIGADAADALDHAHRLGLLHRDVTGRNLMVSRDGRAFVLDFGLAHVAESSRLTNSGVTLGTLAYLAPEVLLGGEAGVASDPTGSESCSTRRSPERCRSSTRPGSARLRGGESHPRGAEPAADGRRCSARRRRPAAARKRPEDRYGSGRDVREALEHAMRHPRRLNPPARRGAWALGPRSRRRADGARIDRDVRAPTRVLYLAVLPFEDTSSHDADGEREAFARGLSQALTASLANVDELHLVAVPAGEDGGRRPRGRGAEARRELVLREGVRRAGSHLRISYAVTNVVSGVPFHGDTLDGTADDLFELEDRVVRSVMRARWTSTTARRRRGAGRRRETRPRTSTTSRRSGTSSGRKTRRMSTRPSGLLERLRERGPVGVDPRSVGACVPHEMPADFARNVGIEGGRAMPPRTVAGLAVAGRAGHARRPECLGRPTSRGDGSVTRQALGLKPELPGGAARDRTRVRRRGPVRRRH